MAGGDGFGSRKRQAKGYEAALGAALGDDLDASIDPAAPAHTGGNVTGQDGALPGGAEPLLRHVQAPPALRRALAQIGVVERSQGSALRASLKTGQRLVSREGDIWRWDGFTQAAEAPTPAARRLVERNRLAELRLDAAEAAREKAETPQSLGRRRPSGATRGKQPGNRRPGDTTNPAATRLGCRARATCAAERRRSESSSRLAALEAAEAGTIAARDEAAQARAALEAALAGLAPATNLGERLDEARARATQYRAAETEARSALQSLARERESRDKRLASIAAERQSWLTRREQADEHRDDIGERLQEAIAERDELADAPNRFILARRSILGDIEVAEADLRNASDARQNGETLLATADREARAAIEAMSITQEDKARAETRVEVASVRLESVVKTAVTDLECEPAGLAALAGVKPKDERPPAAHTAAKLESLRADRER